MRKLIALVLASCVGACVGISGCASDGSVTTDEAVIAAGVALELTLAIDSGEPAQIDAALSNARAAIGLWADDPEAQELLELADVAIEAWVAYEAGGGEDWRDAAQALLAAINRYQIEKAQAGG